MTTLFSKTIRQAGLIVAFAVSVSALSSTQSFAFSAEAQQMCTGDAFRLCSSEIPNIPKITACMVKHRSELSAGCRTVMDKTFAEQSLELSAYMESPARLLFQLPEGGVHFCQLLLEVFVGRGGGR